MNVASVLKVGGQTHPKYLDNKKNSTNFPERASPPPPRCYVPDMPGNKLCPWEGISVISLSFSLTIV